MSWLVSKSTRRILSAMSSTERDRPTRQTTWPGEPPAAAVEDIVISDRNEVFVCFVADDIAMRREAEAALVAQPHYRSSKAHL